MQEERMDLYNTMQFQQCLNSTSDKPSILQKDLSIEFSLISEP